MICVRSNNLSLKYQRVEPTGCRDIEIRNFEVVEKTQFLWLKKHNLSLYEGLQAIFEVR